MAKEDNTEKCANLSLTEEDGPMVEIGVKWQTDGVRKLSLNLFGGSGHGTGLLDPIRYVPFWIQLHNLSIACLCRDVGVYLGGMVGEIKEIDVGEYWDCRGKFIKVKVIVDVSIPFKKGLRVGLAESQVICSVLICYERLPNFCYYCGLIRHLLRECPENNRGLINSVGHMFCGWMRAVIPRRGRFFGRNKAGGVVSDKNDVRRKSGEIQGDTISGLLGMGKKVEKSEENPRLVFLSETHKKQKDVCSVKGRLGFEVDCIGSGGGLMLFWKDCKEVTVKSYNKGYIDAVTKDEGGMVWRFTSFYGNPNHSLRNHSWTLLISLGGMSRLSWFVAGDFNEILSWDEKQCGLVRSNGAISAFSEVVDDCSMIDMGFKGNMFTWRNRQFGEAFIQIQERLDWAFCCLEWRSCFIDVAVVHKECGGSNHKVLVIDNIFKGGVRRKNGRGYRFFFKQAWADDGYYRSIIKSD
ncbi:hypothetical protein LWI28_022207 [Acer negundo]|uniref:CCHC-type domain-containing protein n=1 Tax=Acer negundo TaxID=4023 RepID=A0AAD5IRT0_ACENE|nr:hypothetical protein LWI28_022207 [Acer negundo]